MIKSPAPVLDTSDRPFGLPAEIVLDLPAPPSVNRTRKIDWKAGRKFKGWTRRADVLVLASRCRTRDPQAHHIPGRYELSITLSEAHTKIDLDNGIKWLIDYLRRIEAVQDDSPAYFRRLTVEWGTAPEGCRVTVRACA